MKALFFLIIFCLSGNQLYGDQKFTIGETARIEVGGVPFSYLARIDTGAKLTSIHAINVTIVDERSVVGQNIGKTITFTTMNGDGRVQQLTGVVTKVSTVRNSQGIEQRYVIELSLSWRHLSKKVEVNLRDRTNMTYKLLIGRNWLAKDFLVDVDRKAQENGNRD